MPLATGDGGLVRLGEEEGAAEAVLLQQPAAHPPLVTAAGRPQVACVEGRLARQHHRLVEQAVLWRQSVEQADGETLLDPYIAPGEDDVEGLFDGDEPGQPLGTAEAGEDAEADFREGDDRIGGGDTAGAGEDELGPPPHAVAVHRRHRREGEVSPEAEDPLPLPGEGGPLFGVPDAVEGADVGAGDETARFGADHHRRHQVFPAGQLPGGLLEGGEKAGVEDVDLFAGGVEGDHRHSVTDFEPDRSLHRSSCHSSRDTASVAASKLPYKHTRPSPRDKARLAIVPIIVSIYTRTEACSKRRFHRLFRAREAA